MPPPGLVPQALGIIMGINMKISLRRGDGSFAGRAVLTALLAVFLPAILLVFILAPAGASALEVGDMAPDFHLVTLDGRDISYYADLRGARPLYLMFWTTW